MSDLHDAALPKAITDFGNASRGAPFKLLILNYLEMTMRPGLRRLFWAVVIVSICLTGTVAFRGQTDDWPWQVFALCGGRLSRVVVSW